MTLLIIVVGFVASLVVNLSPVLAGRGSLNSVSSVIALRARDAIRCHVSGGDVGGGGEVLFLSCKIIS